MAFRRRCAQGDVEPGVGPPCRDVMGVSFGPSGLGVVEIPPGEHLDTAQPHVEGAPHDVVEVADRGAGKQDQTLLRDAVGLALGADQRRSLPIVDLAHASPPFARLAPYRRLGLGRDHIDHCKDPPHDHHHRVSPGVTLQTRSAPTKHRREAPDA